MGRWVSGLDGEGSGRVAGTARTMTVDPLWGKGKATIVPLSRQALEVLNLLRKSEWRQ
jgi:integrase